MGICSSFKKERDKMKSSSLIKLSFIFWIIAIFLVFTDYSFSQDDIESDDLELDEDIDLEDFEFEDLDEGEDDLFDDLEDFEFEDLDEGEDDLDPLDGIELEETEFDELLEEFEYDDVFDDEEFDEYGDYEQNKGFYIGMSGNVGFIKGGFFANTPSGVSCIFTTPYGLSFGEDWIDFDLSMLLSFSSAEHNTGKSFIPLSIGVGGKLTYNELVVVEGHAGLVGDHVGIRGFAGYSMDQILKSFNFNLYPLSLLIGGEGFISYRLKNGIGSGDDGSGDLYWGSATYWGGLSIRLDYKLPI